MWEAKDYETLNHVRTSQGLSEHDSWFTTLPKGVALRKLKTSNVSTTLLSMGSLYLQVTTNTKVHFLQPRVWNNKSVFPDGLIGSGNLKHDL